MNRNEANRKSIDICLEELKRLDKDLEACIRMHIEDYDISQKSCEIKNRKLEELSKAKTEFVMEVSHELKAPLTAIMSLLSIIIEGYADNPDQQKLLCQRAYLRAEDLFKLVKDMLDLTRTELYPDLLPSEPFDIRKIILDVIDEFEQKIAEEGLDLEIKFQGDLPNAMLNKSTIKRVIENLISNAIKYNRKNGKIIISVHEADDDMIAINFRDTGIGIPEDEIPKLFEILFRGRETKKIKREGTGLGLSLSKRIVNAHNGKLTVRSKPGEGSTFTFTVQIHQPFRIQKLAH